LTMRQCETTLVNRTCRFDRFAKNINGEKIFLLGFIKQGLLTLISNSMILI